MAFNVISLEMKTVKPEKLQLLKFFRLTLSIPIVLFINTSCIIYKSNLIPCAKGKLVV